MLHALKLLVLMVFLAGCVAIPPVPYWAESGVGQPIDTIKKLQARPDSYASRIGWKETTYQLENGNWVLVDPIRADCFVHWEVNRQAIIVGFKTEGNNCY